MIRATKVHPHLHKTPAGKVVLDHEARHRRRMTMRTEEGLEFLLDLPEAMVIPDGAALILEDGREIEVAAAAEPLVKITAKDHGALLRLAWHIGNRHLPAELWPDQLRIRRDHVIEAMVEGLGGIVTPIEAPFDPESGAYAGGGHHHHGHDHEAHDHGHHDRHGHGHHHHGAAHDHDH